MANPDADKPDCRGSSAGPEKYLGHFEYAGEGRACAWEEVEYQAGVTVPLFSQRQRMSSYAEERNVLGETMLSLFKPKDFSSLIGISSRSLSPVSRKSALTARQRLR
ncbi:MAG: hypothetical protein FD156_418 [Nitrospirae bacterium]|nr:MAG: hypothetical protein FD156_418 [Nitrospirota bacterium]